MKRITGLAAMAAIAGAVASAAPGAAHAESIGDPAGVVGPGKYGISVGTMRMPRELARCEYTTQGYYAKFQGSVRSRLDLYARLGSERLTRVATTEESAFRGDTGVSIGGGGKLQLPAVPLLGFESFLDVSARTFKSKGSFTRTVAPVADYDITYDWRECRFAYGVSTDRRFFRPYGGVTATYVDFEMTRFEQGIPNPPEIWHHVFRGPLYGGFLGVDLRLSPGLSMTFEMIHEGGSEPGFSLSLGEVTR